MPCEGSWRAVRRTLSNTLLEGFLQPFLHRWSGAYSAVVSRCRLAGVAASVVLHFAHSGLPAGMARMPFPDDVPVPGEPADGLFAIVRHADRRPDLMT